MPKITRKTSKIKNCPLHLVEPTFKKWGQADVKVWRRSPFQYCVFDAKKGHRCDVVIRVDNILHGYPDDNC
jgi:hypothetical protein